MTNVKVLEIPVIVRELQTKDGKKFNAYKAVQNNGKLIDLKFRRSKNLPERIASSRCCLKI